MYGMKKTRVLRIEARRRPAAAVVSDRSAWDWYAESCSCGLPPGNCRAHPRGRPSQRPPHGEWRVWGYVAGRGAGKTRAGACWIQHRVDHGAMKLGCLIAPTAADIRDVMVEGPSGLIAVAPPWSRPRFESSKRRVEWPNGARAVCLSGEEPERARGLNIDTLWADELACWQRAESTWDLAMLAETGDLKIHPRCTRLRDAFRNYSRQRRGGQWVDFPADGHPEEDLMDALRGGIRDAMPAGLAPGPRVHQVRASGIL